MIRPSGAFLVGVVKLLVGAYPRWLGATAKPNQRIYFANHTSHVDTLALWSALPMSMRKTTHAVAAQDYWGSGFKHYIATKALKAILIDRSGKHQSDPLQPLRDTLDKGESLIIFPEGTRGSDPIPANFKSGLYHLARQYPKVELIPVYLENLHRTMPKGAFIPIPFSCTVRFGAPIQIADEESKETFLGRAREAVIALSGLQVS